MNILNDGEKKKRRAYIVVYRKNINDLYLPYMYNVCILTIGLRVFFLLFEKQQNNNLNMCIYSLKIYTNKKYLLK
jgi:hypothetical protein